ncbi:hypothetical protein DMB38_13005 [Streptomyces sp. WAC 06738]|nr:hypothetical protein DMB38_13005 [Streptomyces sp. WAC 06738]
MSAAEDRAPAADLPAIRVACPLCGSPAGAPCTSHGGTRERRHDVHRARTAAWTAQQSGGDRS